MTGSGKTFTTIGTDEAPGLLMNAMADCLAAVQECNTRPRMYPGEAALVAAAPVAVPDLDSSASDIVEGALPNQSVSAEGPQAAARALPTLAPGEAMCMSLSCLEIYNEQVYDVLVAPVETGAARPILKIKDGLSGR